MEKRVYNPRPLCQTIAGIAWCLALIGGCSSGPSRLVPPSIPKDAGEAAIKEFDADGDGALAGAELDKSPSLKSSVARIDANNDGKISAPEINDRIQAWRDSKSAIMMVIVTVKLDQRPLQDAEVAFVPEKFLGEAVKTARGKTNQNGATAIRISDIIEEQGVSPGFYRIEISRKAGDKETIPVKFNQRSELGIEVASDIMSCRDFSLNLTSR